MNDLFWFFGISPSVLYLFADVSEHPVCSIFWVEVIKGKRKKTKESNITLFHHFDSEYGTDKVFRNVGETNITRWVTSQKPE
jgi:hypothetical protein